MNEDFRYLRTSVVAAVTLLQRDTALSAEAHHALAVLQTALIHLDRDDVKEQSALTNDPDGPDHDVQAGDTIDIFDPSHLMARSLSDYRQERGMHIPAFTELLGITHQEYAQVIHSQPLDRRLRDQIAYKLGVDWREIAEFMPAQPQTWAEIVPMPAPEDAPLPPEPWYLVDHATGRIVSGPHDTPLPENAGYLGDPLTSMPTNLVALPGTWTSEEAQLPPEGYSARNLEVMYEESAADAACVAADRATLDEPLDMIR